MLLTLDAPCGPLPGPASWEPGGQKSPTASGSVLQISPAPSPGTWGVACSGGYGIDTTRGKATGPPLSCVCCFHSASAACAQLPSSQLQPLRLTKSGFSSVSNISSGSRATSMASCWRSACCWSQSRSVCTMVDA
jgi:hypothetical protein